VEGSRGRREKKKIAEKEGAKTKQVIKGKAQKGCLQEKGHG